MLHALVSGAFFYSLNEEQSLFLNRPPQSSIEVNNRHRYDHPLGDVISDLNIVVDYIHARKRSNYVSKWCRNRMLSQSNLSNLMNVITQLLDMMQANHLLTLASMKMIER